MACILNLNLRNPVSDLENPSHPLHEPWFASLAILRGFSLPRKTLWGNKYYGPIPSDQGYLGVDENNPDQAMYIFRKYTTASFSLQANVRSTKRNSQRNSIVNSRAVVNLSVLLWVNLFHLFWRVLSHLDLLQDSPRNLKSPTQGTIQLMTNTWNFYMFTGQSHNLQSGALLLLLCWIISSAYLAMMAEDQCQLLNTRWHSMMLEWLPSAVLSGEVLSTGLMSCPTQGGEEFWRTHPGKSEKWFSRNGKRRRRLFPRKRIFYCSLSVMERAILIASWSELSLWTVNTSVGMTSRQTRGQSHVILCSIHATKLLVCTIQYLGEVSVSVKFEFISNTVTPISNMGSMHLTPLPWRWVP